MAGNNNDVQVTFGADTQDLAAGTESAKGKIGELGGSLDSVKSQFDGLKDTVGELAAAFGIAFSIDALKNWIVSSAELGEQMEQAAAKLGITAQEASKLSGEAVLTGTSFDALQTQMERFNLNLGEAGNENSRVAQGLKALGLNAKEFVGVPIPQQLEKLAEATSKFADGGNKTAAIMALLGRTGAELLPFLDRGKDGFEELSDAVEHSGSVMTNAQAAAFAKTKEDIDELSLSWQGLSNKIFDVVNPAIDSAIKKFSAWVESVNEGQIRTAIEAVAGAVGQATISIVEFFGDIRKSWEELVTEVNDSDLGEAIGNKMANFGRTLFGQSGDYFKNDKLNADLAKIDAGVAASNARLEAEVSERARAVQRLFQDPTGGATLDLSKLDQKPQAGTMEIGGNTGADAALEAKMTALNAEIAHFKAVEEQKKDLIQEEVKTKQLSAAQGLEQTKAALQDELNQSMAVYKQEEALEEGKPQKLAEVLAKEKALQDSYNKEIQQLNAQAAEQSAQKWQGALKEINSAFDSQISGLLKGTTTWAQAWRNVLSQLTIDLVKFFANWAMEQAENTAMQILGITKVTTAQIAGSQAQAAAQQTSAAAGVAANAGAILQQLTLDAKAVFGGIFGFLAPFMGPAAAAPAAAGAGTVLAYDIGAWELPSDQLAMVHRGEMIVPAAQTPWAQNLMSNAAGQGGDDHYHFSPQIHFAPGSGLTRDALREHADTLVKILQDEHKKGAFSGYRPRR
jgi:hypothetical protein